MQFVLSMLCREAWKPVCPNPDPYACAVREGDEEREEDEGEGALSVAESGNVRWGLDFRDASGMLQARRGGCHRSDIYIRSLRSQEKTDSAREDCLLFSRDIMMGECEQDRERSRGEGECASVRNIGSRRRNQKKARTARGR